MCKVFVDGALKRRNSQRVEFRALDKMKMCYFSCALTELISRHVALEVPLEQLHYQQSFGPTPTAVAADVNRCEDPHKSRSPNDTAECVAIHGAGSHVAGLLAVGGVLA